MPKELTICLVCRAEMNWHLQPCRPHSWSDCVYVAWTPSWRLLGLFELCRLMKCIVMRYHVVILKCFVSFWDWKSCVGLNCMSVLVYCATRVSCLSCSVLYHAVAQLVEVLRYKSEGRGFDSRWYHWNFRWHNPSGRTKALGLTHPLTEMSTRNISWGVRRPVRRADNLSTFMCLLSWNLGTSTSWNPLVLSRPVMGLLYLLPLL